MVQSTFSYGTVENDRTDQNILHDIYRLRYQVYVTEWEFEDAEDYPNRLESDEYDRHSIHYFAMDKSEERVVATARVILNSPLGLPIEKILKVSEQLPGVKKDRIGEISRLAVSKEYRKRAIDQVIFGTGPYAPERRQRHIDMAKNSRRQCEHELIRGLYLAIYRDSKKRGLTHWYAVMAKGLHVILKRWGISFKQIGPAIWYHGIRAPYVLSISDLERALSRENPELLELAREVIH